MANIAVRKAKSGARPIEVARVVADKLGKGKNKGKSKGTVADEGEPRACGTMAEELGKGKSKDMDSLESFYRERPCAAGKKCHTE